MTNSRRDTRASAARQKTSAFTAAGFRGLISFDLLYADWIEQAIRSMHHGYRGDPRLRWTENPNALKTMGML